MNVKDHRKQQSKPLSVKEAAERVGCHPQTMYKLANEGVVKFDRVGRHLSTSETRLKEAFPNVLADEG